MSGHASKRTERRGLGMSQPSKPFVLGARARSSNFAPATLYMPVIVANGLRNLHAGIVAGGSIDRFMGEQPAHDLMTARIASEIEEPCQMPELMSGEAYPDLPFHGLGNLHC